METKALKPTISRSDQSSTAVHRAPDWLMKATLPRRAMPAAKVALTPLMGFITPRQFGPDEAHVAAPGMGQHLALEFHSRRAGFLEAGRDDHRAGNPEVGRFADDARDNRRGRGDHDQVGLLRQGAELGIGLDAQHAGPRGVDRVDRPAEGRVHQVPQHGAADAADLLGGADHGHAPGREDAIQRLAPLQGRTGRCRVACPEVHHGWTRTVSLPPPRRPESAAAGSNAKEQRRVAFCKA